MLLRPNDWKSLRSRYEKDRPHRMLALDGGWPAKVQTSQAPGINGCLFDGK
jgi:hypothetical protein